MSTNQTPISSTSAPAQSRPDLLRIVSLAIAGLVLAAALWVGITSSRVVEPATVHPAARPAVVATATSVGAAVTAQATPSADQSAAWYLQQETTEGNYCQCGNTR